MIRYDCFAFAAPPRTATGWVVKAAQLYGLGSFRSTKAHMPFFPGLDDTIRLSMVRHPCRWLASLYAAVKEDSLRGHEHVSRAARLAESSRNIYEFLQDYINLMPGYYTDVHDRYVADAVLRVEDLPEAFTSFIYAAGEKDMVRYTMVCGLTPVNATDEFYNVHPSLWDQIVRCEQDLCIAYDYS